jgi:hypothetical protein
MEQEELLKRIAELEFENDQLLSELRYLDELMRSIGFSEGLQTVKATARELLEGESLEADDSEAA